MTSFNKNNSKKGANLKKKLKQLYIDKAAFFHHLMFQLCDQTEPLFSSDALPT